MEYKSLEPTIFKSVGGDAPKFDGASPSLFTSTSFLYTLFFVVIVVVASTKYAQAGLFRMEASQRGITNSNEIFKKTTLGLVGVFSLWLILATVNKDLLSGNVGLDALRAGEFGGGGATGVIPEVNPTGEGMKPSTVSGDEASARKKMSDVGIGWNNEPCTEAQMKESKPSCTNLGGLPEETLNMLITLKRGCSCEVTITGGTEPGHRSHGVGKRPVDLRLRSESDSLYQYVKKNGTPNISGSSVKWGLHGYIFWDEPGGNRHFHVY
jgi:hypothetical protein